MRQKHGKADLEMTKRPELDIPISTRSDIDKYMRHLTFITSLKEIRERRLYTYIRTKLSCGLGDRSKTEIMFAALIERIARMSVFLDRWDRSLAGEGIPATKQIMEGEQKDYLAYQQEYRKCIEAYVNLRYSYEQKPKTRLLESLRRVTMKESMREIDSSNT